MIFFLVLHFIVVFVVDIFYVNKLECYGKSLQNNIFKFDFVMHVMQNGRQFIIQTHFIQTKHKKRTIFQIRKLNIQYSFESNPYGYFTIFS